MKRKISSHEACRAKLVFVSPTTKMLLKSHPNPKEIASKAQMEYSNFMRTCKLEKDIQLTTYLKCMNAYDRDVILLSLPIGVVESEITLQKNNGEWYYTIEQTDLLKIIHKVYMQDQNMLLVNVANFLNQIKSGDNDVRQTLLVIAELIQQTLRNDEFD